MESKTFVAFVATAAMLAAQQPNAASHRMVINGIDGPAFPILVNNVKTSTVAVFTITGVANQPYAIFQGPLQTGAATVFGGIVDLAMNPLPVKPIDGFLNPTFTTGPTGIGILNVQVPPVGTLPTGVPLGYQIADQCVMGDPFNSPFGVALTAATLCTVIQGPIVTFFNLGNESSALISIPTMPIPFYGSNYTQLYVCSNGYVTFGTALTDFTPTDAEMNSGPPRIAPFWTDLNCPPNAVTTTFEVNPGAGLPGYLRIDFVNVTDNASPIPHTFAMVMRADGTVEMILAVTNNPSIYDSITGMGPGNNLGLPQTQKNFVGPQPAGSTVGSGILTTPPYALLGTPNMSFYEWFGNVAFNPYYGNPYNNPFDIFTTIHAQPIGSGSLPGVTSSYAIF